MLKKICAGFLAAAVCGTAAFAQTPRIMIDNEYLSFTDAQPFIENDRTLIPMRAVFEALNADIFWDEDTRTVIAQRQEGEASTVVTLQADSTRAFVKKGDAQVEEIGLDVPAKIVDDRTYVPLRFVAEALNEEVLWDNEAYTVIINTAKP